ncbi:MAG: bifunctional DNA-formamidopyrimidine glycosylase/DNA-(apurinic or apyrimidinic site) lyase [Planctomycetota bacterium]
MPELPEVETMRRGVTPIIGCKITRTSRPPCSRRPISIRPRIDVIDKRLSGRRIAEVSRRGKRVMIETDDDQILVIEPRMTGLVLLADPPTTDHLRLQLDLDHSIHKRLLFWDRRGLGTVRLYRRDEFTKIVDGKLGQDAMVVTEEELRRRLSTSRRAIKVALLDQKAVAGIGNLYAAEILYLAGIDPRTRCDRLSRPQWRRIVSSTREVLGMAIAHEGSTLSDGTYRNALNNEGGFQNHHRVYDREGLDCVRCDNGFIKRIVQAQRSTFFCPACQCKSGLHPSVVP